MKSSILLVILLSTFNFAQEAGDSRKEKMLKKFDTNQDGALSKEERKARREARKSRRLKKHDIDGDGKLSEDEREKMKEARKLKVESMSPEQREKFEARKAMRKERREKRSQN